MSLETVENILSEETPLLRRETKTYSKMMKTHFPKIEKFSERGFSFVQICSACEKAGVLPKNANPDCFRQAFRRERVRLKRCDELIDQLKRDNSGSEEEKRQEKTEKTPSAEKAKPDPEKLNSDDEATEKARIRRMTGVTVDTGIGKIVKHSDGTFEIL